MKYLIITLVGLYSLCLCSCNSEIENFTETPQAENAPAFHQELQVFGIQTKATIDSLAEKSFNYNTVSKEKQKLDEDSLANLVTTLAEETEFFLKDNDMNVDSVKQVLNKEQIAYVGLMLLDYEKIYLAQENGSRASIGDCVLRGAGIGELVARGVSKRIVMRVMIKAAMKRCVPYIGWGLFLGETAACLAGY